MSGPSADPVADAIVARIRELARTHGTNIQDDAGLAEAAARRDPPSRSAAALHDDDSGLGGGDQRLLLRRGGAARCEPGRDNALGAGGNNCLDQRRVGASVGEHDIDARQIANVTNIELGAERVSPVGVA